LELVSENITRPVNNFGGVIICRATNSEVIGDHAHMVHIDDPQSVGMAKSVQMREQADRFVFEALSSRVKGTDLSVFVLIMQRLHEADTTAVALQKWGAVHHICLPAMLTPQVYPPELAAIYQDGYLEPIRLGPKSLEKQRKRLDAYGFSGQYMQLPAPPDGAMIRGEWFAFAPSYEGRLYMVIDGAYGLKSRTSDPTGIDIFSSDGVWVHSEDVDLEMPDLVERIRALAAAWGVASILIEPKASGVSLYQTLSPRVFQQTLNKHPKKHEEGALHGLLIESNMVRMGKIERVRYVQNTLKDGAIRVLASAAWWESTKKQLTTFPLAAHDEHVDNLAYFVGITIVDRQDERMFGSWVAGQAAAAGRSVTALVNDTILCATFASGEVLLRMGISEGLRASNRTVFGAGIGQVRKPMAWDEMARMFAGLRVGLVGRELVELSRMDAGSDLAAALGVVLVVAKRKGWVR
jgi:hypothetical protein